MGWIQFQRQRGRVRSGCIRVSTWRPFAVKSRRFCQKSGGSPVWRQFSYWRIHPPASLIMLLGGNAIRHTTADFKNLAKTFHATQSINSTSISLCDQGPGPKWRIGGKIATEPTTQSCRLYFLFEHAGLKVASEYFARCAVDYTTVVRHAKCPKELFLRMWTKSLLEVKEFHSSRIYHPYITS